mgnify:CR=1 FL=1
MPWLVLFCCKHDYDSYCSLVCRSLSIASLHLHWVCALPVLPTPQNQYCQLCPPYLPISIICYFSAYSICLVFFQIKCLSVLRKLVSKALTNLMAHFIFLAPNKLEPLCHLCCICLHLYVGISRTMLSWGTFSTLHLYFVLSWYHVLFSMDVTGVK